MVVVVHQAAGADAKAKQLDSLMQYFDKSVVVIFGLEYSLATSSTIHP
jgi:hypothetical protein